MDPLKIGIQVDVAELSKLATASQVVANANQVMAEKFVQSGMSAKDAESALRNMGVSAANAAAACKGLAGTTAVLGAEAAAAATKISGMDRALASGAIRMASAELGVGQLGYALARVGVQASSLIPIFSALFAISAAVAFVEVIARGVEAFKKWEHAGEEVTHKADDLNLSMAREADALDLVNARLQNQIDKIERKPENFLAIALAEDRLRADQLSKSLEDVLQKEVQILESGPGFFSSILGKANVSAVGDQLEPLERMLQLADLRGDKTARQNILLQEQTILQKALADEQARHVTQMAAPAFAGDVAGREADKDALATYAALLDVVQHKLDAVAKTDVASQLSAKLAHEETAKEAIAAANRIADAEGIMNEEMQKSAQRDLKEFLEIQKEKANEAEKAAKELTHVLELAAKANLEAEKSISKEGVESYVSSWRDGIKEQEEAFRSSQKKNELAVQGVKAGAAVQTSGLTPGPLTNILQSKALSAEASIASAAMDAAKDSAASYNLELGALGAAQAKVDLSTTEGLHEFEQLETQIENLKRQYDSASEAAMRWANSLKTIQAQQKSLNETIATASLNATNQMFNSFNSGFLKMITGGETFGRMMQSVWSSMAESFIVSVLRMGEKWVTEHLLMAAAHKVMTALGMEDDVTSTATSIAATKAEGMAKAGLAGAGGVASMAAAPFPIDLTAPAFGAAMAAAATGFLAFAKGGIVPGASGSAMPILAHGGEAVLPRDMTAFLMGQSSGAASGRESSMPGSSPGREINFHYHSHASALSADGIGDVLSQHGPEMFAYFKGRLRKLGYNF